MCFGYNVSCIIETNFWVRWCSKCWWGSPPDSGIPSSPYTMSACLPPLAEGLESSHLQLCSEGCPWPRSAALPAHWLPGGPWPWLSRPGRLSQSLSSQPQGSTHSKASGALWEGPSLRSCPCFSCSVWCFMHALETAPPVLRNQPSFGHQLHHLKNVPCQVVAGSDWAHRSLAKDTFPEHPPNCKNARCQEALSPLQSSLRCLNHSDFTLEIRRRVSLWQCCMWYPHCRAEPRVSWAPQSLLAITIALCTVILSIVKPSHWHEADYKNKTKN